MEKLLEQIKKCQACVNLPLGPRPVVQGHPDARLLIISQAPGLRVHETGIPWNDQSGDRLRQWLGLSAKDFYNPKLVALLPMGFCYPGRAKTGDAPPRKECYELWHQAFISQLDNRKLTLLIGNYAQKKYLKDIAKKNATETIRSWREYLPDFIPMPHPSPRNNIWLDKNPWYPEMEIPAIRQLVHNALRSEPKPQTFQLNTKDFEDRP